MDNIQETKQGLITRLFKLSIFSLLCTQLFGCASNQKVSFSVIYQHKQCAYADSGIIHLDSNQQQTQTINKLLPLRDEADKIELKQLLRTQQAKEHLFLVAQGSKPTPGYGFQVLAEVAPIEGATLRLPIRFTEPDKDMMLAQVITSPCLILGVDKHAVFQRIQVESLHLDIQQSD